MQYFKKFNEFLTEDSHSVMRKAAQISDINTINWKDVKEFLISLCNVKSIDIVTNNGIIIKDNQKTLFGEYTFRLKPNNPKMITLNDTLWDVLDSENVVGEIKFKGLRNLLGVPNMNKETFRNSLLKMIQQG